MSEENDGFFENGESDLGDLIGAMRDFHVTGRPITLSTVDATPKPWSRAEGAETKIPLEAWRWVLFP